MANRFWVKLETYNGFLIFNGLQVSLLRSSNAVSGFIGVGVFSIWLNVEILSQDWYWFFIGKSQCDECKNDDLEESFSMNQWIIA